MFFSQICWRIWFKIYRPIPNNKLAPGLREKEMVWKRNARRVPSMKAPKCFIFLNQTKHLDDIGWTTKDKLWAFNQHYFDDLNAFDAKDRRSWHSALINDWLQKNPPGFGVGWEPYPTSLRIVNWIKWSMNGETLPRNMRDSLATQTRFLMRRIEYHLLGNHLFANAKALIFAGLFFDGKEADGWLKKGMNILRKELPEQVLSDGGHFELSTMYHSIILEDILDISNMLGCYNKNLGNEGLKLLEALNVQVLTMLSWLQTMCHPDEGISFFNDAAFGIAPSPKELSAYALEILQQNVVTDSKKIKILPKSGFIRVEAGGIVALLDVGKIGPDYLMGHAHADTLTFELSFMKQRVIVNSGTSCYGLNAQRLWERGTAAHNTVTIEGHNSSEIWHSFRVAKRAYPGKVTVNQKNDDTEFCIKCSHDGFSRIDRKLTHKRTWQISENRITILDDIGSKGHHAVSRLHFHPDVSVQLHENGTGGVIKFDQKEFASFEIDGGVPLLYASTWHPEFGVSHSNQCLFLSLENGASAISFDFKSPQ